MSLKLVNVGCVAENCSWRGQVQAEDVFEDEVDEICAENVCGCCEGPVQALFSVPHIGRFVPVALPDGSWATSRTEWRAAVAAHEAANPGRTLVETPPEPDHVARAHADEAAHRGYLKLRSVGVSKRDLDDHAARVTAAGAEARAAALRDGEDPDIAESRARNAVPALVRKAEPAVGRMVAEGKVILADEQGRLLSGGASTGGANTERASRLLQKANDRRTSG